MTQGKYEVSETLLKSMLSLKTAMNELEESPTQEKVKGLGDEADANSLDIDAVLRPVR